MSDSMKLRIDDIVHNEVTNEVGRIVRISELNGRRLGYVVVTATKPLGKEIEALWTEIKEQMGVPSRAKTKVRAR